MAAIRAAASSMPSGSPSSVSQISVTAAAVSGSCEPEVGPDGAGPVDEQRDRIGRRRRPRAPSGDTDSERLPGDPEVLARRGEDLDAPGPTEDRRDRPTPPRSRTCSQLSTTSRSCRPPSASATVSISAASPCGVMPSAVAIAAGTEAGSPTGASSTIHTPSGNSPATSAPTSSASRVLPTPPTPLSVTSRFDRTSSATSATRSSRPTNELSCWGRLPVKRSTLRSTGNSDRSPSATTWYTDIRPRRPRSRCSPSGRSATRSRSSTSVVSETSTWPPCASDISRAARFTSLPK